ncbi:hypothetical protein C1J03_08005 [Sulfitobacter sp. SK012]|nr:hypothetical protein C1J03_08005 [Sulfitobacter sp. SK012]
MVSRIAVAAGNRPILVKPHPRTADPETLAHVEKLAKAHPNVQIVDAHIHDMLASAALTCSISSSVSLEGMMHRKPALLFGMTDFHHIARTIHQTDDVAAALDWALEVGSNLPYAAFLHWFLQKNCINMGRDDWFDRILARVGLDVNQG